MNRDPTVVGRINIIAETFAGVINSFVEPISWKTMVGQVVWCIDVADSFPPYFSAEFHASDFDIPCHSHQLCAFQPPSEGISP